MKRVMMTAAALFACCAVGCASTQHCKTGDACCGACKAGEVCKDGCCGKEGACCGKCKGEAHEHAKMCPDCKDGQMCAACKAKHS